MQTNFIIIGSGISGLNFALHAAQKGQVVLITKKELIDSNTNYAQGGIAAVLNKSDNIQSHIDDTLKAGAHHNNEKAVRFMVENSSEAIHRLMELGVEFEKENGELKLTQEGGHKNRRIAYVGDFTGKEIEKILVKRIKENPNIKILENTFALDLIAKNKICYGVQVIRNNNVQKILADQTIIATGGAGQLYKNTTNAKIATGDGQAMALRAGLQCEDLEFIQFHPTALDLKIFPRFLISEAVRGEGAKLVNQDGKQFVDELASRDIVAHEIFKQKEAFIDARHLDKEYLEKRFPQIYATLQKHGYNMEEDLIPVVPAAHYICGGIKVDLNGQTAIKNLFAFGEVTATGVHGANRLASNSLLEALVFSNQIVENLAHQVIPTTLKTGTPKLLPKDSPHNKTAKKAKKQIKEIMWNYGGIVRNKKQIDKIAIPKMKRILKKLQAIDGTTQKICESKNMATVALQVLLAASKREKSLGCHFITAN